MLKSFYNAKVLQTGCNRVAKCHPPRPNLTPNPTKRATHPNPPEGRELNYLFPVNPYRVNRTNMAYRTNACRLAKHIKLPPFGRVGVGFQYAVFCRAKSHVLAAKRPSFARQNTAFCTALLNMLCHKRLRNDNETASTAPENNVKTARHRRRRRRRHLRNKKCKNSRPTALKCKFCC